MEKLPPPEPRRVPAYPGPLTGAALRAVFDGAADFVSRTVQTPGGPVELFFIDGLVSSSEISEYVLRPLVERLRPGPPVLLAEQAADGLVYNAQADRVTSLDDAARRLVNGFAVAVFGPDLSVAYEVKTGEKRSPSPPEVENTVKGAKDAFTETVRTNTSLLRRHLRTPGLRLWEQTVGRRSLTNVTVVSIEGLTSPELVERVKQRLRSVDVDGLVSPAAVEEYLTGSRRTAFPLLLYTERTDKFATGLLEGRVGVLVDGLPLGYLLPVDLARLMESPEDRGMGYVAASWVRVLRYAALAAALLLPALYLAMAAFHQEMLPPQLLRSIIESKQDVPFPTALEVLALLVAFDLLQEAGLHLPQSIGQPVSIIGGLVVGTAAVEAKLISPAALIIVSVAGICGFTLPERDFADAIRVWRFLLALCAALAGLFGLTAGLLLLLIQLAETTSFGIPYLSPFSSGRTEGKLLRRPLREQKGRAARLRPQDLRNQR